MNVHESIIGLEYKMIELKNIWRSYRVGDQEFHALRDLDLRIADGSFVAVVGKSGSGKSTLANLLTGIDRPTRGNLTVDGLDMRTMDENALAVWRGKNVGIIFQSFQLLPTLTVLENVMLPMDFAGVALPMALDRAQELLAQVGIREQASKLPLALSGGQQQRVAIARALANNPAFLVADEPTGNLDSGTAEDVLDLFSALSQSGKTIVLITHERDLSARVHRVVTLKDGRIQSDVAKGKAPVSEVGNHA
jgi:putative ABC transport system ATP-binding protein